MKYSSWSIIALLLIMISGCTTQPRLMQARGIGSSGTVIPPLATRNRLTATPSPVPTDRPTSTPASAAVQVTAEVAPTSTFALGQNPYTTTLQVIDDNGQARAVAVNYLLYLPANYGRDSHYQWPLIVFLHGAGERGTDPSVITRYSIPAFLTNTLDFPFVVLSPQSPLDEWWSGETDVLDVLLSQVQAEYAVDPRRIFLTGQSMGGFGAWAMALKYPARFAAVVPVASGWDYTSEIVPANICDLKNVPIWVFHGALDDAVPPDQATAMVQALQACSGNVRLTLYPDADHLDSSNRAYADPELYDWLLQQSLPEIPPAPSPGSPGGTATPESISTRVPGDGSLSKTGQHAYRLDRDFVNAKGLTQTVTISYLLYLPGGYGQDPKQLWPLVLFLHGSGERGDNPGILTEHGLPELLTATLDFRAIVLSPQAPDNAVWWGARLDDVSALLDQVQANYSVDARRIYLTGLSMGGFGAWALALRYPHRFAALAPVAGGWDSERDTVPRNICDIKDVPTWVFHGAQDDIVLPRKSQLMVDALEKCGVDVRFTLYPDANHRESFERAYDDPELYEWMFEQHLP